MAHELVCCFVVVLYIGLWIGPAHGELKAADD